MAEAPRMTVSGEGAAAVPRPQGVPTPTFSSTMSSTAPSIAIQRPTMDRGALAPDEPPPDLHRAIGDPAAETAATRRLSVAKASPRLSPRVPLPGEEDHFAADPDFDLDAMHGQPSFAPSLADREATPAGHRPGTPMGDAPLAVRAQTPAGNRPASPFEEPHIARAATPISSWLEPHPSPLGAAPIAAPAGARLPTPGDDYVPYDLDRHVEGDNATWHEGAPAPVPVSAQGPALGGEPVSLNDVGHDLTSKGKRAGDAGVGAERTRRYLVKKKPMGKDAVGTIYHTHHPPTNQDFCMRIIPKAGLQGNRTGASADTVRRTSELWGGLDHPQVMKMFDWWETDTEFVQIFTLVSGGRLSDRIRKHGRFPERDAAVVMATICNAAAYLHSVGVVHRDMRAESVLYRDADPESIMYLGYLDLAVEVPEGGSVTGAVGTVANAAPEILRRRPYSFPADCWSLGILAYQLLSGAHPFVSGRGTVGDAIDCILGTEPDTDGTDWAMVSPEGKEFVRRLLDKEPGTRMTAAEALGNEWLQLYTPRTYLEWLRSITERAAHGHEEEAGLHERVGTNGI